MDSIQELAITLPNLSRESVFVESVHGREALGQAYSFTVEVLSATELDLEPMLGKAARIVIRVGDEEAITHGVVADAETLDPTQTREYCYRFEIVPELALLKLSAQNQVYGTDRDVTVVEIIDNELSDGNKIGSRTASNRVSRTIPHRMLAESGSYPKLDFVMQYDESDYDFLCRMCEKFGIHFSFDHSGDREEVLFCDRKEHFRRLSGSKLTEEILFRSPNQVHVEGTFCIRSFNARHKVRSGAVHLRDYNDETPTVDLTVVENTSFLGHGVRVDYDENFRNMETGRLLARRRVERLQTERLQFTGESNIPLLRPGLFFKLVDHPIAGFERFYVVTEVEHRVVEKTPLGFSSPDKASAPYSNRFVCVPFDTQYRPPLVTPRPVVHGLLVAFIDGPAGARHAQVDTYGRYHVRILQEESGLSGGIASHLVRKAEPYGGGDGYGSHSTLLVGTEVLLAFLHGDPDRPVIVGAMSNASQSNPVIDRNRMVAHRTRTASGTIFQISDG